MQVDIDLDQEVGNGVTIRDAIIKMAAEKLIQGLREEMLENIKAVIGEQIEPLVTKAIEGPVQRTDRLGTKIGEPQTLKEIIVEEAVKKVGQTTYTGHSGENLPLVDQVVQRQLDYVFTRELNEVLKNAKLQALERLGQLVQERVLEALAKEAFAT